MRLLVDTSVLLRTAQPDSPEFEPAVKAITELRSKGFVGCIVPQVIYEFWVVATRPHNVNGLGMTVEEATLEVARIASLMIVLRDERSVFEKWQELVTTHRVTGKNAHDARIVAAMFRHGIKDLLTLNPRDFVRYPDIHVHSTSSIGKS